MPHTLQNCHKPNRIVDDRVKHKILRIFKIWEQRGVYSEDFIADLCGLINVSPGGVKTDDPHEFQASYVINKIKSCANLEKDTDTKLKMLKEHNPKIQINENLTTSLKDRAHVDDVEKEIDVYVKHMESYINALKAEIKHRIALITVLRQSETQLESDRKDVKLVAHAYKTFGQRVKSLQKKLEEHMENLPSPLPSPDINAPSPSPDADLDLPEDSPQKAVQNNIENNNQYNSNAQAYYNPVTNTITTETESSNFLSNGFSSFIGSNVQFDISSNTALFSSEQTVTVTEESYANKTVENYDSTCYNPENPTYAYSTQGSQEYTATDNGSQFSYQEGSDSYPSSQNNELYDPLEQAKTWENNESWENQQETVEIETPESPPMYEKEGYGDPVEYHDGTIQSHGQDVDQRVLPGMGDLEEPVAKKVKGKDIDHRNLISLTGSPHTGPTEDVWEKKDQDYRHLSNPEPPPTEQSADQDYRVSFNPDVPPPVPPPSSSKSPNQRSPINGATLWPPAQPPPLPMSDVDVRVPPPPPGVPPPGVPPLGVPPPMNIPPPNIDERRNSYEGNQEFNGGNQFSLLPPPPLPELLDDVDANQFLDEISNDINEFTNLNKEDDDLMDMEEDMEQVEDDSFPDLPPAFRPDPASRDRKVPPGPPPGLPPGMQQIVGLTQPPPPPPPKPGLLGNAPTNLPPPEPPMPPMNFLPPGPMINEPLMPNPLLPPPIPNWMGNAEPVDDTLPWNRDPRFKAGYPPPPPPPSQMNVNDGDMYRDDFQGDFNNGQMPPAMMAPLLGDFPGDFQNNFTMDNFDQQDFAPHNDHHEFYPRGGGRNRGGFNEGFHRGGRGNRGRGRGGNRRDNKWGGGFRGNRGFRGGGNYRGGF